MLKEYWEKLFFVSIDPLPLGILRIAMGLLLFVQFLSMGTNWDLYFARDGMLALDAVPSAFDPLSPMDWTEGLFPVRAYWWASLFFSITFTIGFRSRISTLAVFVLLSSLGFRNIAIMGGEELVLRMLLFYCCFAPVGATLSIDRILRPALEIRKTWIWPVRMMQIHLALVYIFSLPVKLKLGPEWLEGEAAYFTVISQTWSRWPWPELFYSRWISAPATWSVLLVEGLFPLLVWFPRIRVPVTLIMMAFHIGIAICLANVTFFTLAMSVGFIVFLPAEWMRSVTRLEFLKRLNKGNACESLPQH